ncbi:MAG TPA: ROK family protein [Candidatus Saccharimonadales bacterium]|nr:ROK family protein [Candidatus Saccharimonadales bacterium]
MSREQQFVVALDLGGTKLAGALVNRAGKIVGRMSVSVDGASGMAPVRQMTVMARSLTTGEDARGRSKLERIAAVGVAVPGLVRRDGTVWAPNLKGWTRMPLEKRLHAELGVPVTVESDRNAAVLGESWRGAARGKNDVIVVMIGTGIGAGILSGGRLVRGAHELSGCMGWMTVREEHAGQANRVGQLESLAAGPGIAEAAEKELSRGVESLLGEIPAASRTAQEVAEAARRGDMVSIEVFLEAGRWLGYGVANLVSLFDPEIVVIAGGMAKASDLYLDALRKAMKERAQPIAAGKVRVVVSKLGGEANLLGAARVAWGH